MKRKAPSAKVLVSRSVYPCKSNSMFGIKCHERYKCVSLQSIVLRYEVPSKNADFAIEFLEHYFLQCKGTFYRELVK